MDSLVAEEVNTRVEIIGCGWVSSERTLAEQYFFIYVLSVRHRFSFLNIIAKSSRKGGVLLELVVC